jgi:intermediate filament protein if
MSVEYSVQKSVHTSNIQPRNINIRKSHESSSRSYSASSSSSSSQSRGGAGASGGMSLRMAVAALGGGGGSISGAVREVAANPTAVIAQREREKRDLQELNDRFASYIERVRFLEADNKRLQSIIDVLKVKFEKLEETLKEMYEAELEQARKTIDETTKAKAEVELKVARLEEELADYKRRYEDEAREHAITKANIPKLEKAISERDAQIDFLTKNVDALERELARLKGEIARLQRDLSDAKTAADAEIVARIELESMVQSKDDEINFLKNMYEEKIRQLMDLNFDSEDYRAMFSNELALALRDIRAEYDAILEAQKGADNDSWYKAKFNEMMMTSQRSGNELAGAKDEVKKARAKYAELQKEIMALRAHNAALEERILALEAELDEQAKLHRLAIDERDAEIEKLRAQLAAQILELKELMDSKLALDAEIATYRRLLQGEESRLKEHMANGGGMVVQQSSSSASASAGGASQQVTVTRSEMSAKTTYQRSAKGPISITECSPDGKYLVLENTNKSKSGNKDQALDGWKIKRKVDNAAEMEFNFPKGFVLKSGKAVKVWARSGGGVHKPPEEIVWNEAENWGIGSNIVTTLFSEKAEEKATHIQKTVYENA